MLEVKDTQIKKQTVQVIIYMIKSHVNIFNLRLVKVIMFLYPTIVLMTINYLFQTAIPQRSVYGVENE